MMIGRRRNPASSSSIRKFFSTLLPKKPSSLQLASRSLSEASNGSSKHEFERVFLYFDENCDGNISPTELRNNIRITGTELSVEDAEAAVESPDSDGDGLLGFEDFVKLVEVEGEEEKRKNLEDAFRVYVMDGQDYITAKSLRLALRKLRECKSAEECRVMIRRFDLDGDGVLSFDEFKVMML